MGDGMNAIQDQVIAGGPEDFMEVRHLVLTGPNTEIGRALATLAKERFGLEPAASADRLRTRIQRRYIEVNDPILYDRMRGVAAAFGKRRLSSSPSSTTCSNRDCTKARRRSARCGMRCISPNRGTCVSASTVGGTGPGRYQGTPYPAFGVRGVRARGRSRRLKPTSCDAARLCDG
jgi:hypothetical protein